jgi:hypothetical protein
MAFVPGCRHDVFVSYAHVDDKILPGAQSGWVCTLVDALSILLAEQLGRAEVLAVWRDLRLPGNCDITSEILETVRSSATLLVVLSAGYLASDWCLRERNGFLGAVGTRTRGLFIVERMPIDYQDKPLEFRERLGYSFWIRERDGLPARTLGIPVPLPGEPEYYNRLNRLSFELANELRRMKAQHSKDALPTSQ